ncbi:hypothetical protein HDE_09192 [Halotydeus destructor]|nr:hypothetical protein HDE_09192 [Halotydeus destructor]
MLAKEKEDAKNFIILEDKLSISAVLHRMDKVSVSQFLDAEVDKMYKYSVNRRKFALIKLQDYAQFKKKSVKSEDFLFPMTTRLLMTPGIEKKYLSTEDCNDHVCDVNAKRNLTATREALRKYSREQSDLAINQLISDCSVTEFGSKLRFVWLNQLEELLCAGLFSEFELRPFGSSVNAFGSDHSDLDMVFEPRTVQTEYEANKPRLAFQP